MASILSQRAIDHWHLLLSSWSGFSYLTFRNRRHGILEHSLMTHGLGQATWLVREHKKAKICKWWQKSENSWKWTKYFWQNTILVFGTHIWIIDLLMQLLSNENYIEKFYAYGENHCAFFTYLWTSTFYRSKYRKLYTMCGRYKYVISIITEANTFRY